MLKQGFHQGFMWFGKGSKGFRTHSDEECSGGFCNVLFSATWRPCRNLYSAAKHKIPSPNSKLETLSAKQYSYPDSQY